MPKPLCIDLFCGLGGWSTGFLAEGWDCIGVDIERHVYGDECYPGQLIIQDALTLHGSQFKGVDCIVASPPCQQYSYFSMPWSLAKAKAAAIRADETGTARKELTALFDTCFRIQREACEAAGRHIPMVIENVRGAQEWVGRARYNFGSFYLWGDVPALMPGARGGKNNGGSWFNIGSPGQKVTNRNPVNEAIKCGGDWFNASQPSISRLTSSKSPARKAASALIAKIPLALSRHIAAVYHPAGWGCRAGMD